MSEKADPAVDLNEELVITLSRPLDGPDGPISKITIREPTAGEILSWDNLTGVEADIKAVSVVAGVPESAVRKLPARDFYRAARRIGAFLS